MPGIRILQIDAFTDFPFAGNLAAVCLLKKERDSDWMQAVAAEMNLSETAFVRALDDGFELRWFTPTIEVDLCGHATLAWKERSNDELQVERTTLPVNVHTANLCRDRPTQTPRIH